LDSTPGASTRSDKRIAVQVIPVVDGVWCFRRPSYFACSYLISVEGGGAVAVDVGMDSDAADFLEGLEMAGVARMGCRPSS
jgi:hypothetical protein